jgi:hypothetical protein
MVEWPRIPPPTLEELLAAALAERIRAAIYAR